MMAHLHQMRRLAFMRVFWLKLNFLAAHWRILFA